MENKAYIPDGVPFYSVNGFRVWESAIEGRFVCASPTAVTYRGDMAGVARFIERESRRLGGV